MTKNDITFSRNLHDSDGDVYEECLMIHFDVRRITFRLKDVEELKDIIKQLQQIVKEVEG